MPADYFFFGRCLCVIAVGLSAYARAYSPAGILGGPHHEKPPGHLQDAKESGCSNDWWWGEVITRGGYPAT
jgi:hypothetical protein